MFVSLADWGQRWPAEQTDFAAGLILSEPDNPVLERAVARCLFDLARLGRPLLWGIAGTQLSWYPRLKMSPTWPSNLIGPPLATYARLAVSDNSPKFRPAVDPILFSKKPDYAIDGLRLSWCEDFTWILHPGKARHG